MSQSVARRLSLRRPPEGPTGIGFPQERIVLVPMTVCSASAFTLSNNPTPSACVLKDIDVEGRHMRED